MKYCENCGSQLNDDANFCPYCGTGSKPLDNQDNNDNENAYINDQPSSTYNNKQNIDTETNANVGYACLGFCFPIVGLILYLMWKDTRPKTAKAALIAAAVSFGINLLSYIISFIVGFASV